MIDQLNTATIKCLGNFEERVFWLRSGITEYLKCPECDKELTKFRGRGRNYLKFCSFQCQNSRKRIRPKSEASIEREKRFNYRDISQTKDTIYDYIEKYLLDKNGNLSAKKFDNLLDHHLIVINSLCSSDILGKSIHRKLHWIMNGLTSIPKCMECDNEAPFIQYSKGYADFCSVACAHGSSRTLERRVATCQDKWGVDNTYQSVECQEKAKKTMTDKFGFPFAGKVHELQEKAGDTLEAKHGFRNAFQVPEFQATAIATSNERYDKDYYSQTDLYKERVIAYNNNKEHGVDWYTQTDEFINITKNAKRDTWFPLKIREIEEWSIPLFTVNDFTGINQINPYECTNCSMKFYSKLSSRVIPKCSICYPRGMSKPHIKLLEYITSIYDGEIVVNDWTVLKGGPDKSSYELDIYLPELNLAVEINGNYWHSVKKGKDVNYHLNKTNTCRRKGILLLHFFEDEISNRFHVITNMIDNIINPSVNGYDKRVENINETEFDIFQHDYNINKNGCHFSDINKSYFSMTTNFATLSIKDLGNNEYEILSYAYSNTLNRFFEHMLDSFIDEYDPKSITFDVDKRFGCEEYKEYGFYPVLESQPELYYFLDNYDVRERFNSENEDRYIGSIYDCGKTQMKISLWEIK